MSTFKRILSLCLLVATTAPAFAKSETAAPKSGMKVVYDKKTKYDFTGKEVDGQFLKPDGSAIRGDQDLSFDSLVQPRKNFSKELHRSSGALR